MKRTFVAVLSALSFCAAGVAAHAQEFSLDLSKIDPNSPAGKAAIAQWKKDVAIANCGPLDMPQPIDLSDARANCQANVERQAQQRIDAAIAREDKQLKYTHVVASSSK